MNTEENNILGEFQWEDMSAETDFFEKEEIIDDPKTDAKSVLEEIKKEEEEEDKGKKPEDVKPEDDLFSEEKVIENAGPKEEEDDKDTKVAEVTSVTVLTKMKEKGLIDFELEEGEELTEELAEELIEDKFEESVDNKVKELMGDLSDDKKEFIQFLLKGGDIGQFISSVLSNDTSIDVEADLEKEENQISVMKKLLRLEDKDDEEVEAEVEYLKSTGKLKALTEKKLGKYKKEQEDAKAEFLKEQADAKEAEKKIIKESKAKVASFLVKNEEVNGIKFSKEDKKELPSYMNDKSVKLQNGATITQMQKELFYDLPKNQEALIQLATLLRNRNEDGSFNFDSIVKDTRTKVTQEVKQNVRRDKTSIPGNSANTNNKLDKSLSDYFN